MKAKHVTKPLSGEINSPKNARRKVEIQAFCLDDDFSSNLSPRLLGMRPKFF
jgi:hypothetical protein